MDDYTLIIWNKCVWKHYFRHHRVQFKDEYWKKIVTPLFKYIILSFDKSKEPTITNRLFDFLSLLLKRIIHMAIIFKPTDKRYSYIPYEIKRPHQYFRFLLHYFRKNKYSFFDYRLRTFYLSVSLGHIIADQTCLSI